MNKCMIRKYGVIFLLSTILAYFVLLGLFGEEGFFHASSVRRELEVLKQRQEVLLLHVDSLEQQKEHMTSQDALKDAAFRFGYHEEGEQVYYFADGSDTEPVLSDGFSLPDAELRSFPGFAKHWIGLMALAISSLITVLWGIITQRRK